MFDNITVDVDGNILLQEDPGNQSHTAKVWKFYPGSKRLVLVAQADPARFGDRVNGQNVAATAPFNSDEESSGHHRRYHLFAKGRGFGDGKRDDRDDDEEFDDRYKWAKAGHRVYLGTVQAHYGISGELVEGGQLYMLQVPKRAR